MAVKYTPLEIAMRRLESTIYNDRFRWGEYAFHIRMYCNIPIKVFYGDDNIRYVVLYRRDIFAIDKIMIFRPLGKGSLRWMADPQLTKTCDSQNYNTFGITNEMFDTMLYKFAPKHIQGRYRLIWKKQEFHYLKY